LLEPNFLQGRRRVQSELETFDTGCRPVKLLPLTTLSSPNQAKRLKILVVDDYVDGAEILAEILAGKGHEVRIALDAASALAMVEEFQPHVACLDLGMPIMDGYELALRLRTLPELERIHLIAISGCGGEPHREVASGRLRHARTQADRFRRA
jgi:CheY-like chemotaxis protein